MGLKQHEQDRAAIEAEVHRSREALAQAVAIVAQREAALADAEGRLAQHAALEPAAAG